MDAVAERKQRARLLRRADQPPPMRLTHRDLALMAHIARHRLIRSTDLALLDGGSPQNVLRILRALYDHGYVARPPRQMLTRDLTGARPTIYGLTRRGALALADHGYAIDADADWTERNHRAGAVFIDHTADIAGFMTRLEIACAAREGIGLLTADDILANAPERTSNAREPLRWVARLNDVSPKLATSVVPDGLFGLTFPDGTASYFLLEMDRGTMPVVRRGGARGSFAHKMWLYLEGWRQERHVAQFGIKQLRILTVTTSPERVETMLDALADLTDNRGTNLLLFTDQRSLQTNNPLEVELTTGKKTHIRLTDFK
jgi:hypothetical protein